MGSGNNTDHLCFETVLMAPEFEISYIELNGLSTFMNSKVLYDFVIHI